MHSFGQLLWINHARVRRLYQSERCGCTLLGLKCLKAKTEQLFCNRSEFSNLSRLQRACLTALWSHDTLISSFMKPESSPLTRRPIKANPIRRVRGRDEIGLFNSLYRNMLMQDNDSLIACYYGIYWGPNMRAVTETIAWYMEMQRGPLARGRIQLLPSGAALLSCWKLEMKIDALHRHY